MLALSEQSEAPALFERPTGLQRAVGEGRLSTKLTGDTSRIDRLYQQGCAKIRLPDHRDHTLEAVMINSSGGLTGGDRMRWEFTIGEKTSATFTTQACERIYRSPDNSPACVKTNIIVHEGGHINWLPQETILFDGAALSRSIDVTLNDGATLLMVEPIVFGRKARRETVQQGFLQDRWRVFQNERLIHAENLALEGAVQSQLTRAFIADGCSAMATVLFVSPQIEAVVPQLEKQMMGETAISHWNGKLILRLLAKDSYTLRHHLVPILELLSGGHALPKIWMT